MSSSQLFSVNTSKCGNKTLTSQLDDWQGFSAVEDSGLEPLTFWLPAGDVRLQPYV